MVFKKIFGKQFIEVIEWTDSSHNTMVYRFPVQDNEIKYGAQLTVRESQVAVFVKSGQIADILGPGRHTLTTANLPVLSKLLAWPYGFNSPFKAEVYFVNTKQFIDQKWGTSNPIMMRDQDFGMVRIRAFGIYSFKVGKPDVFLKEVFGTHSEYTVEAIEGQLKRMIVSSISDAIAESKIPALDLSMNYDELSELTKIKMVSHFEKFGLLIPTFYIENISLPKEVEEAMDKRTSMGVLGDVGRYTQFQAADALRDAAQNEGGGLAGAGVGLGAGAAMGGVFANTLNQSNQPQQQQNQQSQPTSRYNGAVEPCPKCGDNNPVGAKFCDNCGNNLQAPKAKCIKCGHELQAGAKFCLDCGTKQDEKLKCAECGKELAQGTKFCSSCGTKVE